MPGVAHAHGTEVWAWLLLPSTAAADLAATHRPIRPWRWALVMAGATALVVALPTWQDSSSPAARPALAAFAVVAMIGVLEAAGPLLRSRTADAEVAAIELAAARERLRLADDLHHMLGRALETVAFKGELAEKLLDVDTARARREIAELQAVARDTMADMRSLVRSYRVTDLAREVEGVRRMLECARVRCWMSGNFGGVVGPAADALGRVVREAVSNMLRHARVTRCWIDLRDHPDRLELLVTNDGATPDAAARATRGEGTGLETLRRHLAEFGGELGVEAGEGRFTVWVVVPRTAPQPGR